MLLDAAVARIQAASVVATLLRRTLTLEERDVLSLVEWYNEGEPRLRCVSEARLVRAVEFLLESRPLSPQLRAALERLAGRFRVCYDKAVRALAMSLEANYLNDPTKAREPEELAPAMVGHPGVLTRFKKHLGILPADRVHGRCRVRRRSVRPWSGRCRHCRAPARADNPRHRGRQRPTSIRRATGVVPVDPPDREWVPAQW